MGAEAAVGEVPVRSGADQEARVVDAGILKDFEAANGNLVSMCNDTRGIGARTIPQTQQPKARGDRGEDSRHDEF